MNFSPLEHRFIKKIKGLYGSEQKTYYVFCSGGIDSIALVHFFKNVQSLFPYTLKLVYVHHGSSKEHKEQSDYRDKALSFLKSECSDLELEFKFVKSEAYLESEEECRNFRLKEVSKILNADSKARVFLGHHKDDHFETLVLRLIRGTGPLGFANPFSKDVERPFLDLFEKSELEDYQKSLKFKFLKDPSNQKNDYLRNWLRNSWLKDLSLQSHGSKPFKASLIKISEYLSQMESDEGKILFFDQKNEGHFDYAVYSSLNQVQKKSIITNALHMLKKSGYTMGQVLEVLKLLEQNKNEIGFKVSGVEWMKTPTKVYFRLGL